ncbi:Crp/Fnr family transcriptional regulator [Belnapia mucosa]|uniref:Crp/Fnr family transcriptional regulator n=1 Tax=Belnapia mucosa TaxID=2804532 RepID=UPI001F343F05|nr:Crp/Fnr family transcriptional regulator [Belnapia mucosa]
MATLPAAELARLQAQLEPVTFARHQVLTPRERPIDQVLFLERGYATRIALMEDGDGVEIGLVGREGMVGLAPALGAETEIFEVVAQMPGHALRLPLAAFQEAMAQLPAFHGVVSRYVLGHFEQVAQTAVCNSRHQVDQRLARWLLMALDRAEGDSVPVTHEALAIMLGVRRASISVAASALQRAGCIHYERGRITVTDRPGLEAAACECYAAFRRGNERLTRPSLTCHPAMSGRPPSPEQAGAAAVNMA